MRRPARTLRAVPTSEGPFGTPYAGDRGGGRAGGVAARQHGGLHEPLRRRVPAGGFGRRGERREECRQFEMRIFYLLLLEYYIHL